jgi:hypothetical protein
MTSFITTMFVPKSPSLASLISPPKPLEPIVFNQLGESASCIRLPSASSVCSLYEAAQLTALPPSPAGPAATRANYTPDQSCHGPAQQLQQQKNPEQGRPKSPVKRFLNAAFFRDQQQSPPRPHVGHGLSAQEKNYPGAQFAQSHLRRSNTIDDSLTISNSRSRPGAAFRPTNAGRGTSSWQLRQYADSTLGAGSLRKVVKLPEGEDENEWLAVNGMSRPFYHLLLCSFLSTPTFGYPF